MSFPLVVKPRNIISKYRKIEHIVKHVNAQEIADRSKFRTRDEGRDMDWADYHDLDTIYAWLDELEGKINHTRLSYLIWS